MNREKNPMYYFLFFKKKSLLRLPNAQNYTEYLRGHFIMYNINFNLYHLACMSHISSSG